MPAGIPPGRAGRMWLVRRLAVARRAGELLERKEHLLRVEERRLRALAAGTAERWRLSCHDAEMWSGRVALLGGEAALRPPPGERAGAELSWRNTMGVTYPAEAVCLLPPPAAGPSTNPARNPASDANRRAVQAAVEHAAADYAHAQVSRELATTSRRRRAINDRWIPDLEATLAALEARLDELEQEERVRTRWALARRGQNRGAGSLDRLV